MTRKMKSNKHNNTKTAVPAGGVEIKCQHIQATATELKALDKSEKYSAIALAIKAKGKKRVI